MWIQRWSGGSLGEFDVEIEETFQQFWSMEKRHFSRICGQQNICGWKEGGPTSYSRFGIEHFESGRSSVRKRNNRNEIFKFIRRNW